MGEREGVEKMRGREEERKGGREEVVIMVEGEGSGTGENGPTL